MGATVQTECNIRRYCTLLGVLLHVAKADITLLIETMYMIASESCNFTPHQLLVLLIPILTILISMLTAYGASNCEDAVADC